MRHHSKDVPSLIADPGNVLDRSIRVGLFIHGAVGSAVSKNDLIIPFQPIERLGIGVIVAFAMSDGQFQYLSRMIAARINGFPCLHPKMHLTADKLERPVAQQRPREKPGLYQNLKAITNAEDETAVIRELEKLSAKS